MSSLELSNHSHLFSCSHESRHSPPLTEERLLWLRPRIAFCGDECQCLEGSLMPSQFISTTGLNPLLGPWLFIGVGFWLGLPSYGFLDVGWSSNPLGSSGLPIIVALLVCTWAHSPWYVVSLSIEFTASETTDAFSPQEIFGAMEPA